ncbi:unnamed protein product [Blepharisma stoltei]|uniref:UBC core domain-containing protein n=1 Tax=Blepharisma stoltei TaxID=1481888 RepID=A0AAU9J0G3_9CILI|nr:unnamed protein product [Blepharisma stoltei]
MHLKRLKRELYQFRMLSHKFYNVWQVDENDIENLIGAIAGPTGSPYEGGIFFVKITIPNIFPLKSPSITFLTKIYHINICESTGAVSPDCDLWFPFVTLTEMMENLLALLREPDLDCIANQISYDRYTRNIERYEETAKEWTQLYAI